MFQNISYLADVRGTVPWAVLKNHGVHLSLISRTTQRLQSPGPSRSAVDRYRQCGRLDHKAGMVSSWEDGYLRGVTLDDPVPLALELQYFTSRVRNTRFPVACHGNPLRHLLLTPRSFISPFWSQGVPFEIAASVFLPCGKRGP